MTTSNNNMSEKIKSHQERHHNDLAKFDHLSSLAELTFYNRYYLTVENISTCL